MPKKKIDAASRPDDENPEWTREDFKRARPAMALVGEVFGPEASQAVAQRRGRPRKASPKINQTLRLDADVVEAYRQQGRGWQMRMNAVLRAHMNDRRK
ncbi:MAG: BrnA antitoxin family protein [Hyphomicrobiales bacterium]|nr:BrnA antitoxin family protein [Hyphomicrobiales bacterium]